MADSSKPGLGSDKMSESKKRDIQSKGGQATGASNLSTEDRKKGGEHSHSGGGNSSQSQ
ncbi:MAG TPA: hypothetical protein VLF43_01255 [Candidatus Saccharimonadales bacterium]|nr:hypothetical protein [Candidatus Saccharimonadales bacterium]